MRVMDRLEDVITDLGVYAGMPTPYVFTDTDAMEMRAIIDDLNLVREQFIEAGNALFKNLVSGNNT